MVGKCYIIRVFVKCDDRRMPDVGQRARFGVFPKKDSNATVMLIFLVPYLYNAYLSLRSSYLKGYDSK